MRTCANSAELLWPKEPEDLASRVLWRIQAYLLKLFHKQQAVSGQQ